MKGNEKLSGEEGQICVQGAPVADGYIVNGQLSPGTMRSLHLEVDNVKYGLVIWESSRMVSFHWLAGSIMR